jgi:hypothetical protein
MSDEIMGGYGWIVGERDCSTVLPPDQWEADDRDALIDLLSMPSGLQREIPRIIPDGRPSRSAAPAASGYATFLAEKSTISFFSRGGLLTGDELAFIPPRQRLCGAEFPGRRPEPVELLVAVRRAFCGYGVSASIALMTIFDARRTTRGTPGSNFGNFFRGT